jgi:hypothetical protein
VAESEQSTQARFSVTLKSAPPSLSRTSTSPPYEFASELTKPSP